MYDVLSAEFTIQEVYSQYDGRKVQVPTKSKAREGVGCSLHYEMFPREEIHVKVLNSCSACIIMNHISTFADFTQASLGNTGAACNFSL